MQSSLRMVKSDSPGLVQLIC